MSAVIRLFVADLDGTLVGSVNEFPLYNDFRGKLNQLRRDNGLVWAACTGRSRRSFRSFFSPMHAMGITPDFVILKHAYIYGRTRFGYVPHAFWNLHIHYLLWANRLYIRQVIDEWYDMVTGGALGVRTFRRKQDRTAVRFDGEESARVAVGMLKDKVGAYQYLKVVQRGADVDVEAVPFTKGLAVAELAGHLGVATENVLAVGDGHNDISMLDGRVAGLTGCPANAAVEVKHTVHASGGHIAQSPSLRGVMEILAAHLRDEVCSDLPGGVPDRPPSRSLLSERGYGSRHRSAPKPLNVVLMAAVAYAVLVVFASFNLVPFISQDIMQPFRALESWLERLLTFIYR